MFLWTEKKFLRGLVDESLIEYIDRWFPAFVVEFLKRNQRLHVIQDKVYLYYKLYKFYQKLCF